MSNHSCTPDNDGQCHFCGALLNPEWYETMYGADALKKKEEEDNERKALGSLPRIVRD